MGGSYLTDMRRLRGRGETRAEIEEYFLSLDAELAARAEQVSCDWSQSEYSPLIGPGGAGGAAGGAAAGERQDRAAQAGSQAGLGARDELLRQVTFRVTQYSETVLVGSFSEYCIPQDFVDTFSRYSFFPHDYCAAVPRSGWCSS